MNPRRQSLVERAAIALQELGNADSQAEMMNKAETLLERYPAPVLLTALLQLLPEADSQLRGGLGLLAQRLPRPVTEQRLLQQTLNKELSAHTRFAAVTILQDFLHRPVDPGFVQDISDVDGVILSSMQDAFAAQGRFPGILIEYTEQFAQLDSQHRQYILDLLPHVKVKNAADLLHTMAYSRQREVGLQALDAVAALKSPLGERILYILSQSLYLDPELSDAARRGLRKMRLLGGRYVPPTLFPNAVAHFLGFDKNGVAHWLWTHEAQPDDGLWVGYGFRQGIRHLQKISCDPDVNGESPLRAGHPECKCDWVRWHLSYTLSHFPPDRRIVQYPESYQLLAPELWQWQPPSERPEALDGMHRSSSLDPTDFHPASIATSLSQLPYVTVLRTLIQRKPEAPAAEKISLCTWFLRVCALAQWQSQRALSTAWANLAQVLEEDAARGGTILNALQDAKP